MARARPTSPSPAATTLYAQPSDVALVNDFLRPWVTSGTTAGGGGGAGAAYIHTADLYSANPEELARRFAPAVSQDGERTWYFLSPLRNKSPRDRRKVRAVADGTGCWHSEAGPKHVLDNLDGDRHVGYRQAFSFMRRGDAAGVAPDVRAGWIMAEFHLHHHGTGKKVEGLVLCKMYRSPRNRGPVSARDAGAEVRSGVSRLMETTTFSCRRNNAADDEESNAVTSRWQRHTKNTHGAVTATTMTAPPCPGTTMAAATAMTAPLLLEKAAGTTTAAAPLLDNKAVADDEHSIAVTPRRRQWHTNNPDGAATATATTMTAPLVIRKAAGDDEVSAATTAAAPCYKNNAVAADDEDLWAANNAMAVDADDEDLLALLPACKKMRMAVADTESSDSDTVLHTDAPAATAQLNCPQCGFHLAALEALVTLTKSKPVVS